MNLRSMKMEAESDVPEEISATNEYPFGLRVHLGNEELENLGLDISTLKAGQEITFTAQAIVKSLCDMEEKHGDKVEKHKNCSLQIKAMAIHEKEVNGDTLKSVLAKVK